MAPYTIKQRMFAFGSNVKNNGSVQHFSGSFAVASTLIEIRPFPHVTQSYVGSMHFVQEVHFRVKNMGELQQYGLQNMLNALEKPLSAALVALPGGMRLRFHRKSTTKAKFA